MFTVDYLLSFCFWNKGAGKKDNEVNEANDNLGGVKLSEQEVVICFKLTGQKSSSKTSEHKKSRTLPHTHACMKVRPRTCYPGDRKTPSKTRRHYGPCWYFLLGSKNSLFQTWPVFMHFC